MKSVVRSVAGVTVTALVSGLGVIGSAGPASAFLFAEECPGTPTAPRNTDPANRPPSAVANSVSAVAGDIVRIRVLANDTDPDGDRLYLTTASSPARGETCVQRDGVVLYAAAPSATDYRETFRYGITDGDRYRTATVTVTVDGVAPARATLKKKLLLKKGGEQVRRRARVALTNPNDRNLFVVAGSPKGKRPLLQRSFKPGQTVGFGTRARRVVWISARRSPDGGSIFGFGLINTRTGRQQLVTAEEAFRVAPGMRSLARTYTGS